MCFALIYILSLEELFEMGTIIMTINEAKERLSKLLVISRNNKTKDQTESLLDPKASSHNVQHCLGNNEISYTVKL